MSQELHYTSAPRGLWPGSQGYCTVACTAQMARGLAERLESLSAYRNLFPPHDARAAENPVAFSHLRVTVAGAPIHVVSRVGFAGLDYTNRANKYAHHVVLDPFELPRGGPAWLLSQPGFLGESWDGRVGLIEERLRVPQGDDPPRVCRAWQAVTGDAGWAGVLAESFLTGEKPAAYLVFEPGTDLLQLIREAAALLPPERRWDLTFSTYFTSLPQGAVCAWRGVVRGSPEEIEARRQVKALVLDIDRVSGRASGGPVVEQARTGGERPSRSAVLPPVAQAMQLPDSLPMAPDLSAPRDRFRAAETYAMVPELATPPAVPRPPRVRRQAKPVRPRWGRAIVGAVCLAMLLLGGTVSWWLSNRITRQRQAPTIVAQAANPAVEEAAARDIGSPSGLPQAANGASRDSTIRPLPTPAESGGSPSAPGVTSGTQPKPEVPATPTPNVSVSSPPPESPARPAAPDASQSATDKTSKKSDQLPVATNSAAGTKPVLSDPSSPDRDTKAGPKGGEPEQPGARPIECEYLKAGLPSSLSAARPIYRRLDNAHEVTLELRGLEHADTSMTVKSEANGSLEVLWGERKRPLARFSVANRDVNFEWKDSGPEAKAARNALQCCFLVIKARGDNTETAPEARVALRRFARVAKPLGFKAIPSEFSVEDWKKTAEQPNRDLDIRDCVVSLRGNPSQEARAWQSARVLGPADAEDIKFLVDGFPDICIWFTKSKSSRYATQYWISPREDKEEGLVNQYIADIFEELHKISPGFNEKIASKAWIQRKEGPQDMDSHQTAAQRLASLVSGGRRGAEKELRLASGTAKERLQAQVKAFEELEQQVGELECKLDCLHETIKEFKDHGAIKFALTMAIGNDVLVVARAGATEEKVTGNRPPSLDNAK